MFRKIFIFLFLSIFTLNSFAAVVDDDFNYFSQDYSQWGVEPSELTWSEMQEEIPFGNAEERNVVTAGGTDPGGDPTEPPIPVGNSLFALSLMSGIYVAYLQKKKRKKSL